MDHIARSVSGDEGLLFGELNRSVCSFEKIFSGTCDVRDTGLNLISFDWIDALVLFSMSLNTVFNTFDLSSVSEIGNNFAHSLKTKFSGVFTENLECCIKVKPTSSWNLM